MSEPYDSRPDTLAHIATVRGYLLECQDNLSRRGAEHDQSKLEEPEKAIFDRVTPKLKALDYGSPAYKASLAEMKVALDHHYAENSHHVEHYPNGIDDMSLFDVLEMAMDWKAASERHATGDIWKSLEINRERFKLSDQMHSILRNTFIEMGW